jgi:hypothetical protein
MRSAAEPRDQASQVEVLNFHVRHAAAIRTMDVAGDDEIVAPRMRLPEREEIARV